MCIIIICINILYLLFFIYKHLDRMHGIFRPKNLALQEGLFSLVRL